MRLRLNAETPQMRIHRRPDRRIERGLIQFLRTLAQRRAFLVSGIGRQRSGQQIQLLGRVETTPPAQTESGIVIGIKGTLETRQVFRRRRPMPSKDAAK
jgi:hypothetical protein